MGSEVGWVFRRYEEHRRPQAGNPVLSHPLQPKSAYYQRKEAEVNGEEDEEDRNYDFVDPLGATNEEISSPEPFLPSQDEAPVVRKVETALDNTLETRETDRLVLDIILPNFAPWRMKRLEIINFSEKDPLPVPSYSKIPFSKLDAPERIRRRMEIMDDMTGLKRISESSHTEIITKIRQMRETLLNNWQHNKRVESIVLMTDLARMLSSTSNANFYPQQWVLATDVLDLFGKLIFDRLLEKSNEERRSLHQSSLSPNFTSDDIPKESTEVAKNWFCKIADIKELIPRFYVEAAMIGCLRFLDSSSIRVNLIRLAKFTHVLQAAYGRAYLSKIAMFLDPADRAPHWRVLNDWMQSSMPQMPELTSFSLEWIIQCVAYGASSINDIGPIWEYCKQDSKRSYLVQAFLKGVQADYLVDHILDVIPLLTHKSVSGRDLAVLGDRIIPAEVPESVREEVFSSVWSTTVNLEKTDDFLRSASSWIRFAARHFPSSYICSVLVKFVWRLSPLPSSFGELIVSFLRNLLQHLSGDLLLLLKDENFTTVSKWLRDEEYCLETSRQILLAFLRLCKPLSVTEFVVAYQMLDHSSTVAQSLRPDSLADEVSSTCSLICSVMDRIDLGSDLERSLQWLVSTRASMGEWSQIVEHVVELLSRCALHCLSHMKPTNKRSIWLRACIANLFITIPSISAPKQRFLSALQGTIIALEANSLPQADAMMKLCAEILNDFPADGLFVSLAAKWLALLVYVPDSPNKKILYLFNAFLNILEGKRWEDESLRATVFIHALSYLSAVSQPKISSAFGNVIKNDVIYGQTSDYLTAIEEYVSILMEKYLELIETEPPTNPVASMFLLEFVSNHFVAEGKVVSFVGNLLKKVAKSGAYQTRLDGVISDLREISEENSSVRVLLEKYNLL